MVGVAHGIAASSVGHTLVGVVVVCALLGFGVVCAMKGKWVFFALGWFTGIFWIVGALRLAKPGSWWARRWYGERELAQAQRRFPSPALEDSAA